MKSLKIDGKSLSTERIAKALVYAEEIGEQTARSFIRELTIFVEGIKKENEKVE